MNDFLIILLGVPIGIATSFIVLLIIYKKSRPKIQIANEISHSKPDSYNIKIINRTKFEIINIRVKLFRVKVSNIPNGTLRTHSEILLEKQEWFSLSKFEKNAKHEDFGWRFKTTENLRNYIENGDFIKFQVIAQNSYSNAIKVFEKRFDSTEQIKNGIHVSGQSLKVVQESQPTTKNIVHLADRPK